MAKENTIYIYGQISEDPVVRVKPTGEPVSAFLVLKCVRRPYVLGEGRSASYEEKRIDYVPVIMSKPELVKQCYELSKNDIIQLKGALTTRWIKRNLHCPDGHEFSTLSLRGYVTPIFIAVREKGAKILYVSDDGTPQYGEGVTPDKGLEILYQNSEISNQAFLLGTVVRPPEVYYLDGEGDKCIAQYQMSLRRRYSVYGSSEKFDCPWVKTINRQAKSDEFSLREGSIIMINGAIQSREVSRSVPCEVCSNPTAITERVIEVFPYSVEYIRNCEVVSSAAKNDNVEDSDTPKHDSTALAETVSPAPPADYELLSDLQQKKKPAPKTSVIDRIDGFPAPKKMEDGTILDIQKEIEQKKAGTYIYTWKDSSAEKEIDNTLKAQREELAKKKARKNASAKKSQNRKPNKKSKNSKSNKKSKEQSEPLGSPCNDGEIIFGEDSPSVFSE